MPGPEVCGRAFFLRVLALTVVTATLLLLKSPQCRTGTLCPRACAACPHAQRYLGFDAHGLKLVAFGKVEEEGNGLRVTEAPQREDQIELAGETGFWQRSLYFSDGQGAVGHEPLNGFLGYISLMHRYERHQVAYFALAEFPVAACGGSADKHCHHPKYEGIQAQSHGVQSVAEWDPWVWGRPTPKAGPSRALASLP